MRRILPLMVGNLLGIAFAIAIGWTMARSAGAAALDQELTPVTTPTPSLTPTVSLTRVHPVALALARWLSQTFPSAGITVTISAADLMALQAQGFGYGEIARALQLVLASRTDEDPNNDLSLEQALTLGRQVGWGQAYRLYGLHPGGRGLGAIMRSAKPKPRWASPTPAPTSTPSATGVSSNAPKPKGKDLNPPRGRGPRNR